MPYRHYAAAILFVTAALCIVQPICSQTVRDTTYRDTVHVGDQIIEVIRGGQDTQIFLYAKHAGRADKEALYADTYRMRGGKNRQRIRYIDDTAEGREGTCCRAKRIEHRLILSSGFSQFTNSAWGNRTRLLRSWGASIGYRGQMQIGGSPWHLQGGFALSETRFSLNKQYRMWRNDKGKTVLTAHPSEQGYSRSSMGYTTIEMPMGLSVEDKRSRVWGSILFVPRVLIGQRSATRSVDRKLKTIEAADLNIRPYGADARVEVGYAGIALYGRVGLLPLIPAEGAEVSTHDFSIGLLWRI